jgi:large subunit ribosomal protein L6
MSRIGKKPVIVPAGVHVKVADRQISVSGPKGNSTWTFPPTAAVAFDSGSRQISVNATENSKQARANHGLTRALLANMVRGVSAGFERRLKIYGTGYNCKLLGKVLHLNVGFSGRRRGVGSQFEMPVPDGLEVVVEVPAGDENRIDPPAPDRRSDSSRRRSAGFARRSRTKARAFVTTANRCAVNRARR